MCIKTPVLQGGGGGQEILDKVGLNKIKLTSFLWDFSEPLISYCVHESLRGSCSMYAISSKLRVFFLPEKYQETHVFRAFWKLKNTERPVFLDLFGKYSSNQTLLSIKQETGDLPK